MRGFLLVVAGLLFVGLIVFVQIRCFPPKAQLVCDLWEIIESGRDNNRPASSA
jgi:hypothetical protein